MLLNNLAVRRTGLWATLLSIVFAFGCRGPQNAFVPPNSAPTVQLTATPTSIAGGQSSVLTVTFSNATSVAINQGIGPVTNGANVSVTPTSTTTYTATATNGNGSSTSSATVTVAAPLSATLVANPTSIIVGGSTTLTWTSTSANA